MKFLSDSNVIRENSMPLRLQIHHNFCCVYHLLKSEYFLEKKNCEIAEALLQLRCPLRKDLNSIVSKCYVLVYDSVRRTFDYYLHCKCLWQLEIICKSWSLFLWFWKCFLGRLQRTLFLGLFRRLLFFYSSAFLMFLQYLR